MLPSLQMFILAMTIDTLRSHLCIEKPRQRLNVTGYDDYYLDCYYYTPPCGERFPRVRPRFTKIKAGSEMVVKLYTPVIHHTAGEQGSFQFNMKPFNSDKFVEVAKVPDAAGLYHNITIKFPNVMGKYTLQVVHRPYQYVPFYSCSDLIFVDDDSAIARPEEGTGTMSFFGDKQDTDSLAHDMLTHKMDNDVNRDNEVLPDRSEVYRDSEVPPARSKVYRDNDASPSHSEVYRDNKLPSNRDEVYHQTEVPPNRNEVYRDTEVSQAAKSFYNNGVASPQFLSTILSVFITFAACIKLSL